MMSHAFPESNDPDSLCGDTTICSHLWRRFAAVVALSAVAVLCALAASQWWFPTLPKDVREAFDGAARQIDSPTISFSNQIVLEQQLYRLAEATKNRTVTAKDCKSGIESIRHTLIEYSLTQGLVKNYIDRSTLTGDEKVAAVQALRRYAAAMFAGKLNEETAAAIESRALVVNTEGGRCFRETLPDAELHDLISDMDRAADDAGIAGNLPPIDVCADVRAIVDRQLRVR